MTRKAVIMAAGRGTRMLQLTKNKPKPLININGRPFLLYLLENLKESGCDEFMIVAGYKKEMIERFRREYEGRFDIKIADQAEMCGNRYGTACPLMCAEEFAKGKEFLAVSGDHLYSAKDLKATAEGYGCSYVAGIECENPQKYGVLACTGDYLEKIIEKPRRFAGNFVNAGLYKFTSDIFGAVARIGPSPRGEYELTDAVSLLARDRKVKVRKLEDYWLDLGNPADVMRIGRFLKENGK